MFSITGRVATALLDGERGFARLERTSGFATRLDPISVPAEDSADFGCVFFMGTASQTVGTRFGSVGGSGFCIVLGLSAWALMPGSRGFEVLGANAIPSGCGGVRKASAVPENIAKTAGHHIAQVNFNFGKQWKSTITFGLSNDLWKLLEYLVIRPQY